MSVLDHLTASPKTYRVLAEDCGWKRSLALRKRAIHQLLTARALRRAAKRMRGVQQQAFEWAA